MTPDLVPDSTLIHGLLFIGSPFVLSAYSRLWRQYAESAPDRPWYRDQRRQFLLVVLLAELAIAQVSGTRLWEVVVVGRVGIIPLAVQLALAPAVVSQLLLSWLADHGRRRRFVTHLAIALGWTTACLLL